MKKVTVESQGLKQQGYDGVTVKGLGRTLSFGAEYILTEAEYDKVEKADLENAYDTKVTVSVSDADEPKPKEQDDAGGPGGSEPSTPKPEGTTRSRGR